VIKIVRNTRPFSAPPPLTPAALNFRANKLATAAVTIPRGATQLSINLSPQLNPGRPTDPA